jgi:antitoxin component YwqK of YwqJK toxin-antitoxin module
MPLGSENSGLASSTVWSRRAILTLMTTPSNPLAEVVHYPNGHVKYRGFLLDGQMHGAWEWFRTDGSLMRSGAFDHGRQVGVWRTLDRSGKVVKETQFG